MPQNEVIKQQWRFLEAHRYEVFDALKKIQREARTEVGSTLDPASYPPLQPGKRK